MTDKQQIENLRPQPLCPDYLGAWPLALGENAQTYESLSSAVAAYYEPSDPIEWIYVRDIIDGEWQKQRMRSAIATNIDLAKNDAIAKVLRSRWNSSGVATHNLTALDLAKDYVGPAPQYRAFVAEFLKKAGLTEEAFVSAAVAVSAAEIDDLERSAMRHQAFRDQAIVNLQRHRTNKVAAPPRPARPVQDVEFQVIEDKSKGQEEAA